MNRRSDIAHEPPLDNHWHTSFKWSSWKPSTLGSQLYHVHPEGVCRYQEQLQQQHQQKQQAFEALLGVFPILWRAWRTLAAASW